MTELLAFITGAFIALWIGLLIGYQMAYQEWMRDIRTQSYAAPKVLTFTRSTTTSRGHR